MKPLMWIGVVMVVVGCFSFFIAFPHTEQHGIRIGETSLGVQTTTSQKLPPLVSGLLVVGGMALMITSARRPS